MPARQSVSSAIPLLSQEDRFAVTVCMNPRCQHPYNMRGPFDTPRSKTDFTFRRTYACLNCWWERELLMKDDILEAETKHRRSEAKKQRASR